MAKSDLKINLSYYLIIKKSSGFFKDEFQVVKQTRARNISEHDGCYVCTSKNTCSQPLSWYNVHTGAADDRNEQFINQFTPRNINQVSSGQQRPHVKVKRGCLDPPKGRLCKEESRNVNAKITEIAVTTLWRRSSRVRGDNKWKRRNYQLYTRWAGKNKHHHVFTTLHRLWTKAPHGQSGGSRR